MFVEVTNSEFKIIKEAVAHIAVHPRENRHQIAELHKRLELIPEGKVAHGIELR